VVLTDCESGTWGRDCRHECGECDISDCDINSGFCKRGCSAGFKLPRCTTGITFKCVTQFLQEL
jgi:hypothetical protein